MKGKSKISKTAMIVYNFFPFDPRVRKEADVLRNHGINIDVYCIGSKSESKTDIYNGINIFRVQTVDDLANRVSFIRMLMFWLICFKIIVHQNYKIIHIHDLTAIPPGILYKLFRIRTITIYDSHELFPENARHIMGIGGMLYSFMLEMIARPFLNALVSVSDTIRLMIQKRYRFKTSFTVMNTPLEYDMQLLFKEHKENSVIRIIYAGTIQPYRGYLELLQAVNILKNVPLPPFKIIIAGDGPLLAELKEFSQKHSLDDMVVFTGLLNVNDYYKEISNSHIGLILFKGEFYQNLALPIKAFEYIFGNLMVVCNTTLFPSGKELMRRYLPVVEVNSQDPQSIAEGLSTSILNFQSYASTKKNLLNYKKSIDHLCFDKQMKNLLAFYQSYVS